MTSPDKETREEFEARYPRPTTTSDEFVRVLARCRCEHIPGEHWIWAWWDYDLPGLFGPETLAEEVPARRG